MRISPPQMNLSSLVAGGVVATVVVVVIAIFALRGLYGKLTLNNELLSKKRAAQTQLTDNLEALDSLKDQYASLGTKKKLILDALPTSPDFPAIVSMMENLSKNAAVALQSVTPSESESAEETTGPIEYEFSATVSGGYESFKSFLKNVELSLRPLAITTMKINGTADLLTVEMTLVTYYQKEFDPSLKTVPLKPSSDSTSTSIDANSLNSSNLNPAQGVSQ